MPRGRFYSARGSGDATRSADGRCGMDFGSSLWVCVCLCGEEERFVSPTLSRRKSARPADSHWLHLTLGEKGPRPLAPVHQSASTRTAQHTHSTRQRDPAGPPLETSDSRCKPSDATGLASIRHAVGALLIRREQGLPFLMGSQPADWTTLFREASCRAHINTEFLGDMNRDIVQDGLGPASSLPCSASIQDTHTYTTHYTIRTHTLFQPRSDHCGDVLARQDRLQGGWLAVVCAHIIGRVRQLLKDLEDLEAHGQQWLVRLVLHPAEHAPG